MLPAQKEGTRAHVLNPAGTPETFAAFGNVVKSIQGLEQRLEELSVAEVSQAHATAHTLTVRLAELQRKLASLSRIKHALAASQSAVENALANCVDADQVDAVEHPLRAPTASVSSKLIIFPRPNKPASGTAPATGNLAAPTGTATPASQEIGQPIPDFSERDNDFKGMIDPQENEIGRFVPVSEVEIEPSGEGPQFDETLSSKVDLVFPPKSEPEKTPRKDSFPSGPEKDTAGAASTNEFDQRLLDDLIQNYGEFVASRKAPDAVQKPQQSAQTVKPSDELPAQTDPEPDEKGPTGFRERTEVDRQLKKIIEDYGQYDLYSHKSRISLKILLLGALILIGLVVFGFYYFYPTVANAAGVPSASRHSPQAAVGSAPEAGDRLKAPLALHGKDVVPGTN